LTTLTLITVGSSQTKGPIEFTVPDPCPQPNDLPANPLSATGVPLRKTVRLATQLLREKDGPALDSSEASGGLWVGGDLAGALDRLRWIAGLENAYLFHLASDNKVSLNAADLSRAARVGGCSSLEAALALADFLSANEGLLLLVWMMESSHRYLLFLADWAPTAAGPISVGSALNLDRNYDSRINPRRRNGAKLATELPPSGFDSLVAINPAVRWFNLRAKLLVPPGNIAFHELAEAYAKVELGYDYLPQDSWPGAHNFALEKEERLLLQRPLSNGVTTRGQNRILTGADKPPEFHVGRDR
jgi:hypothetical protein